MMKQVLLFALLFCVAVYASTVNEKVSTVFARRPRTPRTCTAWACRTEVNQTCGAEGATRYECGFGTWCYNGECIPTLPEGSSCDPSSTSALCEDGTYCSSSDVCTPFTYTAGLGDPCTEGPYVSCAGQFVCNFTTLTCDNIPILGQDCGGYGECGGDSYCNYDTNICTAYFSQPVGAVCEEFSECLPELYCDISASFPGTCAPSVNSSFDECTTAADCPSDIETCTCNFLPYNDPTRCEGPYYFNSVQAQATGEYYQCLYNNNCGEVVCDACADTFCNYFSLTQNISISLYGYPELWCMGEYDIITFVEENCL